MLPWLASRPARRMAACHAGMALPHVIRTLLCSSPERSRQRWQSSHSLRACSQEQPTCLRCRSPCQQKPAEHQRPRDHSQQQQQDTGEEEVREQFIDEYSESTPDGRKWPRPTQILMEPGDACITVYQIPHSGTRNEHGTESRKTIIFRIRNKARQPNVMVNGVSDHPDRGQMGEWLEFEDGNNPWEKSKDAMCNMWDEWEGMTDVVREMQVGRRHDHHGI